MARCDDVVDSDLEDAVIRQLEQHEAAEVAAKKCVEDELTRLIKQVMNDHHKVIVNDVNAALAKMQVLSDATLTAYVGVKRAEKVAAWYMLITAVIWCVFWFRQ